jgi:CxxC-x17-CxxC domain-containing protein
MSYNREDREMFDAKCGDCGTDCQVPFQPKQDRPVYCRECFQNHKPEPHKGVDLVVDQVELIEVDSVEEMTDHEKCMMQNAEIVERIVKYHSDQRKIDLFIAENASKITDNISKLF